MGTYRKLKGAELLGSGAAEQADSTKAEGKKLEETKIDPKHAVTTGKV